MTKKAKTEIVESLRVAATRLNVERHVLQDAKARGCLAFRPGNRIDLIELRRWLAAAGTSSEVENADPEPWCPRDAPALAAALKFFDQFHGAGIPHAASAAQTLAAWAVLGMEARGCPRDVASFYALSFLDDVANGRGDEFLEAKKRA